MQISNEHTTGTVRRIKVWLTPSSTEADKFIAIMSSLAFLRECKQFSVEEASCLIAILFPTKTKSIYTGRSSYSFKHLFESVSMAVNHGTSRCKKYCSNQTAIEAFQASGFRCAGRGINKCMNLSAKEVERAYKLFGYRFPC